MFLIFILKISLFNLFNVKTRMMSEAFTLDDLRKELEQVVENSDNKINKMNDEIDSIKKNIKIAPDDPNDKIIKVVINEFTTYKTRHQEESANILSNYQIRLSNLRFQLAELRQTIAKLEAENAMLVLKEIECRNQITNAENQKLFAVKMTEQFQTSIPALSDEFVQRNYNLQQRIQSNILDSKNRIENIKSKVEFLGKMMQDINALKSSKSARREKYSTIIDYLIRSIFILLNNPYRVNINPDDFINDPSLVDSFILECKSEADKSKQKTKNYDFLNVLSARKKPNPRSYVVRALNDLGAASLYLNDQMTEERNNNSIDLQNLSTESFFNSFHI